MTALKTQAIEILQEIPDDKVSLVIRILKELRVLYTLDNDSEYDEIQPRDVMGICRKYANPELIPLEKEAWGEAVKEKYAAY